MSGAKIPPDEALHKTWNETTGYINALRAVATLAAKQAAEQAVKDMYGELDRLRDALRTVAIYAQEVRPLPDGEGDFAWDAPFDWRRRSMKQEEIARAALGFAAPTPPKEQQPVTDPKPSVGAALIEGLTDLRDRLNNGTVRELKSNTHAVAPTHEPTVRKCIAALRAIDVNQPDIIDALEQLIPRQRQLEKSYIPVEIALQATRDARAGYCPTLAPVFSPAFIAQRHGFIDPAQAIEVITQALRDNKPNDNPEHSHGYALATGVVCKALPLLRAAAENGGGD